MAERMVMKMASMLAVLMVAKRAVMMGQLGL